MDYYLNLHPSPFKLINEHHKDVEMRLFDERRKNIKINDHLILINQETKEELKAIVLKTARFNNFEELYDHYDKKRLGYLDNEIANPKDMNKYYSDEQIKRYGVLAIEIKLID